MNEQIELKDMWPDFREIVDNVPTATACTTPGPQEVKQAKTRLTGLCEIDVSDTNAEAVTKKAHINVGYDKIPNTNSINIIPGPSQLSSTMLTSHPQKHQEHIQKWIEAERRIVPGTKFDQDKLPLNLLSTEALNQVAAVLKFGANKYAEHNWRGGFKWSRPLAAAMRHITAFNDGEDKDPESGLSHLAHAACCIMFLLEFEKTHKELDDRFKVT